MPVDNRLCQLPISEGKVQTTYCMRPMNHAKYDPKGKCSTRKTEADKAEEAKG